MSAKTQVVPVDEVAVVEPHPDRSLSLAEQVIANAGALERERLVTLFGVVVLLRGTNVGARVHQNETRDKDDILSARDAWHEALENCFDPDHPTERVFTREQADKLIDDTPASPVTRLLQEFNDLNGNTADAEDEMGKDS